MSVTLLLGVMLSGCGISNVVAAPFKVAGAVVNVVTPDIVGDSISGVGTLINYIPI